MNALIAQAAVFALTNWVPRIVRTWQNTDRSVSLEEWLQSFGKSRTYDEIIAEAKERRSKADAGQSTLPPSAPEPIQPTLTAPDGRRVATAYEVLQAALTGEIPDWFTPAEKKAALGLRSDIES